MVIPLIPMNNPLFDRLILPLALLHCLIGLIAAAIAYRKGYALKTWLVLGLIGGTPSLIYALTRPQRPPEDNGN
jgi:hypothetical protein